MLSFLLAKTLSYVETKVFISLFHVELNHGKLGCYRWRKKDETSTQTLAFRPSDVLCLLCVSLKTAFKLFFSSFTFILADKKITSTLAGVSEDRQCPFSCRRSVVLHIPIKTTESEEAPVFRR